MYETLSESKGPVTDNDDRIGNAERLLSTGATALVPGFAAAGGDCRWHPNPCESTKKVRVRRPESCTLWFAEFGFNFFWAVCFKMC